MTPSGTLGQLKKYYCRERGLEAGIIRAWAAHGNIKPIGRRMAFFKKSVAAHGFIFERMVSTVFPRWILTSFFMKNMGVKMTIKLESNWAPKPYALYGLGVQSAAEVISDDLLMVCA